MNITIERTLNLTQARELSEALGDAQEEWPGGLSKELKRLLTDLEASIEDAEKILRQKGVRRKVADTKYNAHNAELPWVITLECGHTIRREYHRHEFGKPPKHCYCKQCVEASK